MGQWGNEAMGQRHCRFCDLFASPSYCPIAPLTTYSLLSATTGSTLDA